MFTGIRVHRLPFHVRWKVCKPDKHKSWLKKWDVVPWTTLSLEWSIVKLVSEHSLFLVASFALVHDIVVFLFLDFSIQALLWTRHYPLWAHLLPQVSWEMPGSQSKMSPVQGRTLRGNDNLDFFSISTKAEDKIKLHHQKPLLFPNSNTAFSDQTLGPDL